MEKYTRKGNAFDFYYSKNLASGEEVIIALPEISVHKMSVCDIGWQCDGSVKVYATCQENPENATLWQEVSDGEKIAETTAALKIINFGGECLFVSRVIMA